MSHEYVLLALIVVFGVTVQTSMGFGSMLVGVTLGALLMPVSELVPILVPVTMAQTVMVAVRDRAFVVWPLLLRWVLPWMGVGMAVSFATVRNDLPGLRPALGLLVLGLGLRELARRSIPAPLAPPLGVVSLVAAGVVHALFATGGPLLVFTLGREKLQKRAFRATVTMVWLILNIVLITTMVAQGRLSGATLQVSVLYLPCVAVGVLIGQWLHDRVDDNRFRRAVWALLCIAAVPLIL